MKFYIAGPFFCKEERTRVEQLEKTLSFLYYNDSFFSPMRYKVPFADSISNQDWSCNIYDEDLSQIRNCDTVLAIYDGHYSDSGTAFEVGFAKAIGKNVVLLIIDRWVNLSIMPVIAATAVFEFDEFIKSGFNAKDIKLDLNVLK